MKVRGGVQRPRGCREVVFITDWGDGKCSLEEVSLDRLVRGYPGKEQRGREVWVGSRQKRREGGRPGERERESEQAHAHGENENEDNALKWHILETERS